MKNIETKNGGNVVSNIYSGDSLSDIAIYLREYESIFMILDSNLSSFEACITSIAKIQGIYYLHATESDKNMETVMDICHWLMEKNANRDAFILGVGGGITTDITGMAACIYKRGVRFGFLPTTLLAQTDAAIGGKNGVNFGGFKNILGLIHQPEFTFECSAVLTTLPYEEFLSGAAELLKSFIIQNEIFSADERGYGHYEVAVDLLSKIHSQPDHRQALRSYQPALTQLILAAATIKAGIVSRDMNEHGERRMLNLGHTFAHAIEWKSGNEISHGKAVAIGMILAARLSEAMGVAQDATLSSRLTHDFSACGLPVTCPYPIEELAEAMQQDKKAENGQIRFILIHQIGEVSIRTATIEEILKYHINK